MKKLFISFKMILLLFLVYTLNHSCTSDTDLFNEVVQESIQEEITDKDEDVIIEEDNGNTGDNSNANKDDGPLKAFPSAYGAGASTVGGRGGVVLHVTNLNDSGAGSFREALRTPVPRIIVFDVSGIINLESRVLMEGQEYGNVTVAGQTAPEGGITITGGRIWWAGSDNVIVRYIKFRNGHTSDNGDCLTVARGSSIVIDHCSFSYATDEALDVSGNDTPANDKITLQKNLFGECKTAMIVGANGRSVSAYGSVSVLRNATANVGWRFPKAGGALRLDVINNVHHNWRFRTINMDDNDYFLNQINNYYGAGWNTSRTGTTLHKTWTNLEMSPKIYSSGNVIDNYVLEGYDANPSVAWSKFSQSPIEPRESWFVSSQLPIQGESIPILSAEEAFSEVLSDVGANAFLDDNDMESFYMDSLDEGYISLIRTRSNSPVLKEAVYGQLAASYPSNSRSTSYDTDFDGMSDSWEIANFGDLSKDSSGDEDGDGYTNIEEFFNIVDN